MSDLSNEVSSFSTQRSCECYKKLQTYGIPLYINDENEFYGEGQGKITYENAFQLPGVLKINENITEYLSVEENELCHVFPHMAEIIPKLMDFEQNLLSFWILDMFIEGLWTAQNAKMNFDHQKATLYWIAYMFNYIQKENPTRKGLFDHLKKTLFYIECTKVTPEDPSEETLGGESEKRESTEKAGSMSWHNKDSWKLPLPPNIEDSKRKDLNNEIKISTGEEEEEEEEEDEGGKSTNLSWEGEISKQSEDVNDSLTNVTHMKVILDILYRIFGRFWVYLEIQTVFHAMPSTKQVDLPFTLKVPKPLLKTDTSTVLRSDKISRKPSYYEKSLEEVDSGKQLYKNDFILPLQAADESKLILKQYFPQPSSQRSIMGRRKT